MEGRTATPISIRAIQAGLNLMQIISTTLVNSRRITAIDSVDSNKPTLMATIAESNTKVK
jgi:hypothetical protein